MSEIAFTSTQQSALSKFREFLAGPEQVFMLRGAAGTGKTTLLNEFVKIAVCDKRTVKLMAPTGRAAFILQTKTGHEAATIHRSIYSLRQLKSTGSNKETDDDGGLHAKFGLKGNDNPLSEVYIIDEASMVSDIFSENEAFSFGSGMLLTDLFTYVNGRKLVFVGDYAQLPPVGMNFSPALDKKYVEDRFDCRVVEITLSEVVRHKSGCAILDNATAIRDSIEARSFVDFNLRRGADAIAEDTDILNPYFGLSPTKPDVHSVVIAYSNKQALGYNLSIRRRYYGDGAPRLIPGDILMVARNHYGEERELFNGNIVRVEACQADDEVESRLIKVKTGKDRYATVELRFRNIVIAFNNGKGRDECQMTILDNFLDDPSPSIGGLLARALVVDFENRMPQGMKEKLRTIRRLMREGHPLTVEQKEMVDAYNKLLLHDRYYNALICKYGYAITCHKAQGGEWRNVFVDMSRMGSTANEDYFRWAYTAMTRASERLWFYRAPEFSYISRLVVEPIQPSSNIRVSTYAEAKGDFCSQRLDSIRALCEEQSVQVVDDRSAAWQHRLSFTSADGATASFVMWYNKKGYSGRNTLQSASSDDFANLCHRIIDDSLLPPDVPFEAPSRPLAEKLVDFVKSQLKELDIHLLDITQEQYQDVFHLRTDGQAKVIFVYNAKGAYTYMKSISSIGMEDAKLEAFRCRFK